MLLTIIPPAPRLTGQQAREALLVEGIPSSQEKKTDGFTGREGKNRSTTIFSRRSYLLTKTRRQDTQGKNFSWGERSSLDSCFFSGTPLTAFNKRP